MLFVVIDSKMETIEMRMIGWGCGVCLREGQPSIELHRRNRPVLGRLGSNENVQTEVALARGSKGDAENVKLCTKLVV